MIKQFETVFPTDRDSIIYIIGDYELQLSASHIVIDKDECLATMISELEENVVKEKASLGGIFMDWFSACAGFNSLSGVNRVERQNGYHAERDWRLNLPSGENPISWFINPEEINDVETWSKLLTPVSRTLSKSLDPSFKRNAVMISVPPIAANKSFPEWESVFVKSKLQSTELFVSDIGSIIANRELMKRNDKEKRLYILSAYHDNDNNIEVCSISGYEVGPDGRIINAGSLAYKPKENEYIDMKTVEQESISYGGQAIAVHIKKETDFMWSPVEIKLYKRANKKLFLSKQSPYFGLDYWNIIESADTKTVSPLAKSICKVIKQNDAQSVETICSKMTNSNPSKSALEDLIAVSTELQENPIFTKTTLVTKREELLGSMEIPVDSWLEDVIGMIPCNYYNFEWKTKKPSGYLGSYHSINVERIRLDTLISVIVDHFDHCTTATVAEELLAFFNVDGDPSAYFTVRVFLYLSNCSNLVITSQMSRAVIEA